MEKYINPRWKKNFLPHSHGRMRLLLLLCFVLCLSVLLKRKRLLLLLWWLIMLPRLWDWDADAEAEEEGGVLSSPNEMEDAGGPRRPDMTRAEEGLSAFEEEGEEVEYEVEDESPKEIDVLPPGGACSLLLMMMMMMMMMMMKMMMISIPLFLLHLYYYYCLLFLPSVSSFTFLFLSLTFIFHPSEFLLVLSWTNSSRLFCSHYHWCLSIQS